MWRGRYLFYANRYVEIPVPSMIRNIMVSTRRIKTTAVQWQKLLVITNEKQFSTLTMQRPSTRNVKNNNFTCFAQTTSCFDHHFEPRLGLHCDNIRESMLCIALGRSNLTRNLRTTCAVIDLASQATNLHPLRLCPPAPKGKNAKASSDVHARRTLEFTAAFHPPLWLESFRIFPVLWISMQKMD